MLFLNWSGNTMLVSEARETQIRADIRRALARDEMGGEVSRAGAGRPAPVPRNGDRAAPLQERPMAATGSQAGIAAMGRHCMVRSPAMGKPLPAESTARCLGGRADFFHPFLTDIPPPCSRSSAASFKHSAQIGKAKRGKKMAAYTC